MERDELPDIQHRLHRHAQYWPFADVCLEAADALDRAESELARLRREIEALCEQADYANERGVWVWDIRRILGAEGGTRDA